MILGYILYQFILDKKLDLLKPIEPYIWIWFLLALIYIESTVGIIGAICFRLALLHYKIDIYKKIDEYAYTHVKKLDSWIEKMINSM